MKNRPRIFLSLRREVSHGIEIKPPAFNSKEKAFERWKTELTKAKMGIAVALSIPEHDSTMIREQAMEEVTLADLKQDDGLKTLLTVMEKKSGKDDMEDCLEKYDEFKQCKRESDQKDSYMNLNKNIIEFLRK